uniref:Golgi associated, gamma adaptin ear containing, ARF binding protein 3a n=1 Tax=Myripristis murdjan TaxID=586833 RepID=A0A668AXD2_9TELE
MRVGKKKTPSTARLQQIANMAGEGESLESWLTLRYCFSCANEFVIDFFPFHHVFFRPQISVRLLAHKIQSPQEWEAIQALTVLEACMKNCGRRFHNEVGKFRFLNELIKVVSPKYLGDKVSERVKAKVIEMLYSWTVSLPDEAKIFEAYQMLKTQGIVSVDPEIPLDNTLIPSPPPRPKNPVFDNEEKSRRLAELLKSKKPEDLQEANRLIKNMVKEDEVRIQRVTKQKSTLEEVNNSVKLLNEMLTHFSPEDSTDGDKELIRELYSDCDKLRRSVFQLATETEDNDSSLGDILQASDDLSRVINSYKKIVEGQTVNGEREESLTPSSTKQGKHYCTTVYNCVFTPGVMDLGSLLGLGEGLAATAALSSSPVVPSSTSLPLHLGGMPAGSGPPPVTTQADDSPLLRSLSPVLPLSQASPARTQEVSLANVFVPLETIKPSKLCPVTAYDKDGVRVLLHFATDCPPGRPDVLVMVASMLNTAPLPVRNVVLQAAVPKSMKVRLQPPSGIELAPFNPILPPAAITQVMLLANPLKEKVRMRYKLTFTLGEQPYTEVGEVDHFPPAERWGAL